MEIKPELQKLIKQIDISMEYDTPLGGEESFNDKTKDANDWIEFYQTLIRDIQDKLICLAAENEPPNEGDILIEIQYDLIRKIALAETEYDKKKLREELASVEKKIFDYYSRNGILLEINE